MIKGECPLHFPTAQIVIPPPITLTNVHCQPRRKCLHSSLAKQPWGAHMLACVRPFEHVQWLRRVSAHCRLCGQSPMLFGCVPRRKTVHHRRQKKRHADFMGGMIALPQRCRKQRKIDEAQTCGLNLPSEVECAVEVFGKFGEGMVNSKRDTPNVEHTD